MALGLNPLAGGVIGNAWMKLSYKVDSSGLKTSKQSMLGLGLAAGSAGKQIKMMFARYLGAAALIAAVKNTTAAFIEFDMHLRNTHTLITATEVELQKIGKGVRALARDFNVSAAASQASLYQIYSATFYGAEAMHILEQGAKGAVAGLAELKPTVDMLTTVLNAYRMSADQTTHINDLLFTAIRYGKTTLVELSHQFGRLAGVAAPVGASIEDMTAAIATLTRQGIMTDWAITSLRQTLMQFIKPTQNLKKALLALGYESGSAMVKHYGFAGALKKITAWAKENNVEMDQMFTNIRAITAVLPLATIAAGEYAKDQERMANAAGAAAIAFTKAERSIAYQLKKFTTLVNDMAISIGKVFIPALMGMVKALELLVTPLRLATELFDVIGGDYFIAIAAGVGVLITAIWALNKAFIALVGLMGGLMASKALMFSVLGVGGGIAGQALKSLLVLGGGSLLLGLGKAAGAGLAGAFAVQSLINFDLKLGEVTGAESVKRGIFDSLKTILGGAIAGAIIGGIPGAIVGTMVSGAAIIIKVMHEVSVGAAERAVTATEAARGVFAMGGGIAQLLAFPTLEGAKGLNLFARSLVEANDKIADTRENFRAMVDILKEFYVPIEGWHGFVTGWRRDFGDIGQDIIDFGWMVAQLGDKTLETKQQGEGLLQGLANLSLGLSEMQAQTLATIPIIADFFTPFGVAIENISTQFARAQEAWNALADTLSDQNITTEEAIKTWSDMKTIQSLWTTIAQIAIENRWEEAEAIAAFVEQMGEVLEVVKTVEIQTWADQIGELATIMNDATAIAKDRAAAEQTLISLYSQLENIAETTSIPAVQAAALAAMDTILAVGVSISAITITWANQIATLAAAMHDGTQSIEERLTAETTLKSLYNTLTAMAEDTSLTALVPQLEALISTILATGINVSIVVQTWADQIGELATVMTDATIVAKDRAAAEQALVSLYSQLENIAKTTAIPAIGAAALAAMDMILTFGISIPKAINPTIAAAQRFYENISLLTEAFTESAEGTLVHILATQGLQQALEQATQYVKDLADESKTASPKLLALIAGIEALGITLDTSKSAVDIFNNAIASIRNTLTSVASQISSAFATLEQAIISSTTLGEAMSGVAGLLAGAGNIQSFRENLERIITGTGFSQEVIEWAREQWGRIQGAEPMAGMTYEQIAREREQAAREAAQEALQAAREAAAAQQKAFRDIFKTPILESLRSGDWMKAAEAIRIFALSRNDLMSTAAALSTANDQVIDEAEVLQLIVGAQRELLSTLDSMILAMRIAGEDATALEEMKYAIEDLFDPLGELKKKLREVVGVPIAKAGLAGEQFRALINVMLGRSTTVPSMRVGGLIEEAGLFWGHAGEAVIPAEAVSSAAGGMEDMASTLRVCTGDVCYEIEQVAEAAQTLEECASNVCGTFEQVAASSQALTDIQAALAQASAGNVTALTDLLEAAEPGSETWNLIFDSIDEYRASIEGLISDYEVIGESADALKINLLNFDAALQETTPLLLKMKNALRDLLSSIGETIKSGFKELIREFFSVGEAAESLGASLNVPTGYKVTRAAWAAAAPGIPGIARGAGEGFSLADWAINLALEIVGALTDALVDFMWENFIDNFLWTDVIQPFIWDPIVLPAIEAIAGFIASIISGIATLRGFGAILAGLFAVLTGVGVVIGVVEAGLAFLWGAVQGVGDLLSAFFKPIIEAVGWAWEALTPLIDGARKLFGSLAPIMEIFGEVVAFGIRLITPLFSVLGVALGFIGDAINVVAKAIKFVWDYTLGPVLTLLAGSVAVLANFFIVFANVISDIIKFLTFGLVNLGHTGLIALPTLQGGGKILSEGLAYLHAGEIVAPAALTQPLGAGVGGDLILDNTIMLDGSVLWHGMRRVNRNEERRKTGSSIGGRAWRSG